MATYRFTDISTQLLVNVDPRFRTSLYPALSNLDVSPATRPSTVKAIRVKAAPFGAGAPKPIVSGGATTSSGEWLLVREPRPGIALGSSFHPCSESVRPGHRWDPGGDPVQRHRRSRRSGEGVGNLALPAIALKSVTVVVTPSANQVQFAFFTAGAPDGSPAFATITVILVNNSVLDVKIGDEPSRQVSPSQARIRDALFGNEVDIVYTASPPSGGNPSLIVPQGRPDDPSVRCLQYPGTRRRV